MNMGFIVFIVLVCWLTYAVASRSGHRGGQAEDPAAVRGRARWLGAAGPLHPPRGRYWHPADPSAPSYRDRWHGHSWEHPSASGQRHSH